MQSILFPIHLSFAGIWLGCVLTEVLFERALLGKGPQQELILAHLHKRVDLIVEIPAFTVVSLTGLLMWPTAEASFLLETKVGFGLLAVVTNIYCVWLVFRRAVVADQGNWDEFLRLDSKQHKFGAIVLLAIILALISGFYLYGKT